VIVLVADTSEWVQVILLFWLLHYCYVSAHWEGKGFGIEKWIAGSGA
jgi:hypothetical protein